MYKNAIRVAGQTLVSRNNCFSVWTDDEKQYKIVNFYIDNLDESLFPVRIKILGEHVAIIDDERLKDKYNEKYCYICCPFDLLPEDEKKKYLEIEERIKEWNKNPTDMTKELKAGWTIKEEIGIAVINKYAKDKIGTK